MIRPKFLKHRSSDRIFVNWHAILLNTESGSDVRVQLTDVAEGGLGGVINSDDMVHVRDTRKLTVRLKSLPDLEIEAKTVWMTRDGNSYRIGVSFENLRPSVKELLQKEIYLKTGYAIGIEEFLQATSNGEKSQTGKREILSRLVHFTEKLISLERSISEIDVYSKEYESNLISKSEELLRELEVSEKLLPDIPSRKELKSLFRNLVANWAYKSALVRRGYEKPLGYPGDYKMLEMIYNNSPISKGFGAYWDNYFLQDPYAYAVRSRKDCMKAFLRSLLISRVNAGQFRILNLACGSCREIRELALEEGTRSIVGVFTCVDQDEEALTYSRAMLAKNPGQFSYVFVQENILNYARHAERYSEALKNQDMVYSIGLADYLPDKILTKFVAFAYSILKKGGVLVFAHKDAATHQPLAPKWYCDWEFVQRGVGDFVQIVQSAGIDAPIEISRDSTNHIFFLAAAKT